METGTNMNGNRNIQKKGKTEMKKGKSEIEERGNRNGS